MKKMLDQVMDAAFKYWLDQDRANTQEIQVVKEKIVKRIRERYNLPDDQQDIIRSDIEDTVCIVGETAFNDGFLYCYQLLTGSGEKNSTDLDE